MGGVWGVCGGCGLVWDGVGWCRRVWGGFGRLWGGVGVEECWGVGVGRKVLINIQ